MAGERAKVLISPAIFKIESDPVKVADTVNEVNSNKTSTM